jgi:uncharacterized membrane protein
MKKDKFLFIMSVIMVAIIVFLIAYIIILGDNMSEKYVAFGLSLASFGLGTSTVSIILNNIKIEE